MMNKNYFLLSIVFLLFCFTTSSVRSQVLVYEDFESDITALQDLPGWDTALPIFAPTTITPCEGNQSIRVNSQNGTNAFMEYLSQVSTGADIEITFDYKVIDEIGGGLSTGNPVVIDLSYTVDNGTTWVNYDTINTFPTLDCSTHTATIPAIDVPAGSDFGWRMDVANQGAAVYVYVDDFFAVEQVPCIQPINVEVDSSTVTFDGATISWEDLNTPPATSYTVYYCTGPSSNPGGAGTLVCQSAFGGGNVTTTSTQTTLTGLLDGQDYWVYVVADCGGPLSEAAPVGGAQFQTVAIGSYCEVAIEANATPSMPDNATDLPYTDSSQTDIYGSEDYSGAPGGNCGTPLDLLDGFEVVYHFTSSEDDILTMSVTNLDNAVTTGLFIYEDCADIGGTDGICFDGGSSTNGQDIEVNSLFVDADQELYIVIATVDSNGDPINSNYDFEIEGFDCSTWIQPNGDAIEPFVAGQTLADFSNTSAGVSPTINGASLQWYTDNNGSPGTPINPPLSNVSLNDQDLFFVSQNIASCESPFLMVTFEELDCLTDLGGVANGQTDEVCESGELSLSITKNSSQYDNDTEIYWFDQATGGEPVGVGPTFDTPVLTQTTSYYATEVFLGEAVVANQASPGPVAQSTDDSNFGIMIDATEPLTIVDVQVYAAGSGNLELELAGGPSGFTPFTKTVALTSGTVANPSLNTINLNWVISSPGQYYLRKVSGPSLYYTEAADANFPYSLGSAGEINSGANAGGGVNSDYYYFYNWTIRGPEVLCETSRVEVEAIVHEILPITATASNMVVCAGATADLTASSADTDYQYTWTWPGGGPLTGANIQPTILGNTTFTVEGYNPITTCSTTTTIDIEANGVNDLGVIPTTAEVCSDEIVRLTAGSEIFDFESGAQGWTFQNNSSAPNGDVSGADWKIVNSPYSPNGFPLAAISSSDNSNYFIANGYKLGPNAILESFLISPSFNFVGVQSAEISFEYLFKNYVPFSSDNEGYFDVVVNVNGQGWENVETQLPGEFDPQVFTDKTVNLDEYVGASDVKVGFKYRGTWDWWLAIDNVVLKRDFSDGLVSWSPTSDLYFDEQATIPYDGSPSNEVYFTQSSAGQYQYTALLDFSDCPDVTSTVDITVSFTNLPTTSSTTQEYISGETTGDLDVTGTDIRYYIIDDNGDYDEVTVNYILRHDETYYITQTLNNCESDYLAITAELDCPAPSDLTVGVQEVSQADNTVSVIIDWTLPTDITSVQSYILRITENGNELYKTSINDNTIDFKVVSGLPKDTDLLVEIYSICDPIIPVESATVDTSFKTLVTKNVLFNGLDYYPNPTQSQVNFENSTPIEKIEIYSLTGQKIKTQLFDLTTATMSLEGLAAGTYFASIYVEGSKRVVRIIKE